MKTLSTKEMPLICNFANTLKKPCLLKFIQQKMSDIRQNFNLPYPIINKIVEKLDGDDEYQLANTCKLMQRICCKFFLPNFIFVNIS